MKDYFENLILELKEMSNVIIISNNISKCEENYTFDLFEYYISDEIKYLYNHYKKFQVYWEEKTQKLRGFIDFIPYEKIIEEHKMMNEISGTIEEDFIENQDMVINDLKNWYPVFKFPNGDAFCYDRRNGKIAFLSMKYLIQV